MLPEISKIKGVHPGAILKRELKILGFKSKELVDAVDEHKQTISAILNERRGITPALSIKLGRFFNTSEDYFLHLQASYDVQRELNQLTSEQNTPDLTKIRKALFWDTDFDKIDWQRNRSAIIKRVFERGSDKEIEEIIAFYGRPTVELIIENAKNHFLPSFNDNVRKYVSKNWSSHVI
jgi:addiction module HigA family antidote